MVTTSFFRCPEPSPSWTKRDRAQLSCAPAVLGSLLFAMPVLAREPPPQSHRTPLPTVAAQLLHNSRPLSGAVVVLDVSTGETLVRRQYARASHRGDDLIEAASAPAASLFKLVTATALLERRLVTPETVVCYAGGHHRLQLRHLLAPPTAKRRCQRFGMALGLSINAIFARLASNHLTPSRLAETARQLGFSSPEPDRSASKPETPVRPERASSHVELHHPVWGEAQPSSDRVGFARFAAGFQGSRLSVQGAAQLALLIARGGEHQSDPSAPPVRLMTATTAQALTRMMEVTVHSGTSREAFTAPDGNRYLGNMRVAGKTGTLAAGRGGVASWFMGFAPADSPEVALAVLLINDSAVWRRKANQLGRDLLRAAFDGRPGVVTLHQPYWDDDARLASSRRGAEREVPQR